MEQYVFGSTRATGSERRTRRDVTARKMGGGERVFMSECSLTCACFAALTYANSTCRLWDKALDASECNFLPYLLGKYFDGGGGHAVLLLENIPALRRWGFYNADSQIVRFSPAPFIAGNYGL